MLDTKLKNSNDDSLPSIEKLLKATLKKEKKEEEKVEDGAPAEAVDHDEAKVATIMKLFKAAAKPVAKGKSDMRSFLK